MQVETAWADCGTSLDFSRKPFVAFFFWEWADLNCKSFWVQTVYKGQKGRDTLTWFDWVQRIISSTTLRADWSMSSLMMDRQWRANACCRASSWTINSPYKYTPMACHTHRHTRIKKYSLWNRERDLSCVLKPSEYHHCLLSRELPSKAATWLKCNLINDWKINKWMYITLYWKVKIIIIIIIKM